MTRIEDSKRRLIWHGMFLFLLGLLTGFDEQQFNNPRMGLAAHLEGVMNGTFLIALGAVWTEVRLSPHQKAGILERAVRHVRELGNDTLAAIFGAASLSPITGAGHSALPWQEQVVTFAFITVGIAIVVSSILVLWGLRRAAVS